LETEPEIVAAILDLTAGRGAARDLNRQIYQDALNLQKNQPGATYHTRTAQRLAQGSDQ
jgi:hypothetical protein